MNKTDIKLTKIVATIGPASDSKEKIRRMIKEGVNVFRFNTKHGTVQWHEDRIKKVQSIADEMKKSVGIMIDLQGPEIRIETREGKNVSIGRNEKMIITSSFKNKDALLVIPHKKILNSLKKGDRIFVDDANIVLDVVSNNKGVVFVKSRIKAIIENRKGVNIPSININLPALIEADLTHLDMASMNKVDFVALSFARNNKDVKILKSEMAKRKLKSKIVVKIENQQAINNLDDLINEGDAIMVARGDLGVELPIEKLAHWQKKIIDKCRQLHKPVITATEMLDSMISKPRPTRAEATDVSNAVYEGTDALMLSGETATGRYHLEAVKMMAKIAKFTESVRNGNTKRKRAQDPTQIIGIAAMEMIMNEGVEVDKIVVFTQTGYTARVISSLRPKVPIIAVTDNQQTVEVLSLVYGVFGEKINFPNGKLVSPDFIINKLDKRKIISKGESVLVIHGARWKEPGLTNSISLIVN